MKDKIKQGMFLIDDVNIIYEVIEVFLQSVVVQPIQSCENCSCEIMTFKSMENEKWMLLQKV